MGDVAAARYPHHGRIFATQFSVFIGIPFTLLIFKVWRIMHPSIWLPLDWCAKILFAHHIAHALACWSACNRASLRMALQRLSTFMALHSSASVS